jgi:hypothetical protein
MPRLGRCFLAAAAVAALLASLAGCDKSSPTSPTPVCTYSITPAEQSFGHVGGPGQFGIGTDAGCAWAVEGMQPWLVLQSPASGLGPAAVQFTVLENASESAREMSLMVANHPFRIRQDGKAPCTFSISPETQSFNDTEGTGQVQVTTGDACVWTAVSNDAWIAISGGATGRGNGTIDYKVSANTATTSRTGTATIAGRTLTVSQSGRSEPIPECTYSVTPVSFTPCMAGGTLSATLSTQATCRWTASTSDGWLSAPASGTGTATIAITYGDNYDAPRDGVVMLRWPTATAGQNLHVAQAGCSYGVSKTAMTFAAAGGNGSFDVLQQSHPIECGGPLQDQCVWTATASASWITITSSMPRKGDNPIAFTVAPNTGAARSATITVRDKVVTISQSAP